MVRTSGGRRHAPSSSRVHVARNTHPAFIPSPLHCPFSRKELHGLWNLSVPDTRRALLGHLGAPSLGLFEVLGWVFQDPLHVEFGPHSCPRHEPRTKRVSLSLLHVTIFHVITHCFHTFPGFLIIRLGRSGCVNFPALTTFTLQSLSLVLSLLNGWRPHFHSKQSSVVSRLPCVLFLNRMYA